MKTPYTRFSIFLYLLLLVSSFAHAVVISDSSVTLTLDWSSLDSAVVWNTDNYKYNGADADLDGVTDSNYQSEGGWIGDPTLTYTAQVTSDAIGIASTTDTSAAATAHTRADGIGTISPPQENVVASGTSHRGKVFSPILDGSITFTFEYTISQIFSKDDPLEAYSAWSIAELNLSDGGVNIGHDEFVLNNAGTTETGFLGFTVDLSASKFYYLEGHVFTSSSANAPIQETSTVPEPATLVLMGVGLAGLGFARRRRLNV